MDNIEKLAIAAYEAYCETRGWRGYNGDPLPYWPDVKPDIQEGWRAAAKAAVAAAADFLEADDSLIYDEPVCRAIARLRGGV